MSSDGQRIKWPRNVAENFSRLSTVHERYRRQTDGRTTTYSEREHSLMTLNDIHVMFHLNMEGGGNNGRGKNGLGKNGRGKKNCRGKNGRKKKRSR